MGGVETSGFLSCGMIDRRLIEALCPTPRKLIVHGIDSSRNLSPKTFEMSLTSAAAIDMGGHIPVAYNIMNEIEICDCPSTY